MTGGGGGGGGSGSSGGSGCCGCLACKCSSQGMGCCKWCHSRPCLAVVCCWCLIIPHPTPPKSHSSLRPAADPRCPSPRQSHHPGTHHPCGPAAPLAPSTGPLPHPWPPPLHCPPAPPASPLPAGQLYPGPHLFAGAGITVLWALAAALVPAMSKGNEAARSAHIALNTLNILLFAWQVGGWVGGWPTGGWDGCRFGGLWDGKGVRVLWGEAHWRCCRRRRKPWW